MSRHAGHVPFYVAVAAAAVSCLSALRVDPLLSMIIAFNTFFATYLVLLARRLANLPAKVLQQEAPAEDVPVWVIFLITLCAVAASFAALFVVLNARTAPGGWSLLLALSAVPLGWFAIHMMAAVHYAHLYWQPGDGGNGDGGAARGIEFPGTPEPGGIDFVYFAFVIGMTAQTSDVVITTPAMRRRTLLHAVVSFFFNTVLVAAAVNAAVTLGN